MTEQWKATREAIQLNELVAYAISKSYKPIIIDGNEIQQKILETV